jgi:hypothetical protein
MLFPRAPAEEGCPVGDELLADMYRANRSHLRDLVAIVVPDIRASLALFCYRRSHLHDLGLAIAASCDESDLVRAGGTIGGILFARSREAQAQTPNVATHYVNRRKITLATGPLRTFTPDDELDEEATSDPSSVRPIHPT